MKNLVVKNCWLGRVLDEYINIKLLAWPFRLTAGRSLAEIVHKVTVIWGRQGPFLESESVHIYIYNLDNPGTNTDISRGLKPPRRVRKSPMPPTGRSLIGWGSYIIEPAPPGDDSVPSPVQGSFHISQN